MSRCVNGQFAGTSKLDILCYEIETVCNITGSG